MSGITYRKRGSRKPEDRIEAVEWVGFHPGDFPKKKDGKPVLPEWFPPLIQEVWDRDGTYDDPDMQCPLPGDAWKCGDAMIRIGLAEGVYADAQPGDFVIRYPSGALGTMKHHEFHNTYRAI